MGLFMRNSEKEAEKTRELTQELEAKGYVVKVEPSLDELPFSMHGYRPDLVAQKGQEGIIIEIKGSLKRLPINRFQDISKQVSDHKGWRFALVTLDDPLESSLDSFDVNVPDLEYVKERFKKIDDVIRMQMLSAAILEGWSLIEACLRICADRANIPVTFLEASRLINHLYSEAEISMGQTDQLKELMKYRNKVAHGINTQITLEHALKFKEVLSDLIFSLERES